MRWQRIERRCEGLKQVVADPRHHGERREEHRERETDGIALEQQHDRIRDLLRDLPARYRVLKCLQRRSECGNEQRVVEPPRDKRGQHQTGKHRNAIEPTYAIHAASLA